MDKAPRDAKARLLLGSLLTERKNYEAVSQLAEAVRLLPRSAEAENALAEAYLALDDVKDARPALEKSIALKPNYGLAQLNLGRLLLQGGEAPAAAEHLNAASKTLADADDQSEAQYLLGRYFSMRDDPAAALTHLEKAVQLNPNFPEAWSELGATQQLLQDDAAAVRSYQHAVTLNPADSVAQYRLGAELSHLGKAAEAIGPLKSAYNLNPQDQSTLNALQSALRRSGRTSEADQVRRKLAELLQSRDEKNQHALEAVKLNNQGAALDKSGDLNGAVAAYKSALALDPEHNGFRVNYAVALLKIGEWTEGLNQLHEAAQRDPANSQIQLALKDALSQAPPNAVPVWNAAK